MAKGVATVDDYGTGCGRGIGGRKAAVSETVLFAVVSVDRDKVSVVGEIWLPLYRAILLPLFRVKLCQLNFQGRTCWGDISSQRLVRLGLWSRKDRAYSVHD